MKRICFTGLTVALTCAAISSAMSAFPVTPASALCLKVIPGEVSSWEKRTFRFCNRAVLGTGGFTKVTGGGFLVAAGVVCYKVQQAVERSGWEDKECTKAKVGTGLFIKVVGGGKGEEEEGEETLGVRLLAEESYPVTFKSTSGATTFETAVKKTSITCTADTGSGEFENAVGGTISIDFTGCKSSGAACSSENASGEKDAKETILEASAKLSVVTILNAKKELVGGVATRWPTGTKVTCGLIKVQLRGSAVGLVSPINKETETATLDPTAWYYHR